jgi:hypothetical protein
MRSYRWRFTVKRMMVIVAIVAVLMTMGLGITPEVRRRWNQCHLASRRQSQLALFHAAEPARAALHRKMSRRNWWAFFDPFHECVLDQDIY